MIVRFKILLCGGALLVTFLSGFYIKDKIADADIAELRLDHSKYLQAVAEANAEVILKQAKEIETLSAKSHELDLTYSKELKNAKEYSSKLVADLASANKRLSVRVKTSCPADSGKASDSTSSGLHDGAGTRVDLHPAVAAGIFRVSGKADQCQVKLTGLQGYVKNLLEVYGAKK